MATTIKTLIDGPQHVVVRAITDAAADVSDEALITPSGLSKINGNAPTSLVVEEVWFSGNVYVLLEFNASTDSPFLCLGANAAIGQAAYLDFREFGGIKDPKDSGTDGVIQWTTTGVAAGRQATIVLKCRKIYASI